MSDHDEIEARLRRTLRWVAGTVEDRGDVPTPPLHLPTAALDAEAEQGGLFLDDDAPQRRPTRRPLVLAAASVVLLAAVGVAVGVVVAGSGTTTPAANHSVSMSDAAARTQVVSALGATTAAGNWNISYDYSEVPGSGQVPSAATTTPTTTPAATCVQLGPSGTQTNYPCGIIAPGSISGSTSQNVTVTGTGVIDVNPKAMVTTANPSDFGEVVLRIDPTQVWELGSEDGGGLAPSTSDATAGGQSISGFASLVESTLGTREGAVAMLGIASPTGYLVLDEQEIGGVTPSGQDSVNGTPVTEYKVSADPTQLASDPTASAEEVATIRAAISTLQTQGLSSTTADVAVDAQGFIVQSVNTYRFSDGGSVTVKADFSNFGCAGTVLMPGQVGPTQPPANCVSPDSPQATTTTTSTSTSSTGAPTTTSVRPSEPSTTTSTPSAGSGLANPTPTTVEHTSTSTTSTGAVTPTPTSGAASSTTSTSTSIPTR